VRRLSKLKIAWPLKALDQNNRRTQKRNQCTAGAGVALGTMQVLPFTLHAHQRMMAILNYSMLHSHTGQKNSVCERCTLECVPAVQLGRTPPSQPGDSCNRCQDQRGHRSHPQRVPHPVSALHAQELDHHQTLGLSNFVERTDQA
jgi:hypothetical protein